MDLTKNKINFKNPGCYFIESGASFFSFPAFLFSCIMPFHINPVSQVFLKNRIKKQII